MCANDSSVKGMASNAAKGSQMSAPGDVSSNVAKGMASNAAKRSQVSAPEDISGRPAKRACIEFPLADDELAEWDEDDDELAEWEEDDDEEVLDVIAQDADTVPAIPGPVDPAHVDRFQNRFRRMFEFMVSWAKNIKKDEYKKRREEERPVALSVFVEFQSNITDGLLGSLLAAIPAPVQSILGTPDLRPCDLLRLPMIPREAPLWGTYIDIATSQRKTKSAVDAEGAYVGSSFNQLDGAAQCGVTPTPTPISSLVSPHRDASSTSLRVVQIAGTSAD
ncbi:hypothetical protein C8A00DRAFT_35908 [Chaetomidium leptoderma]|uniref:Uncharacterized protein n=1 Tax=Chaetomidium leptoderma TaxID=669021 RepID=A0AAN6ZTM2_9PEZI|nr:hypothetical protein C8A00DRAFT_35908 [Chaetomidium leptoderma]